jgi:hypothetical protein
MRLPKSIDRRKLVILLLVAFVAALFAESLNEFGSGLVKVRVIVNYAQFGNGYAEGGLRVKCNFLDKALQNQWLFDNTRIADHLFTCIESGSPRESHLPTKSGRAPPETYLS